MTSQRPEPPARRRASSIEVLAVDSDGLEVLRTTLAHGDDPERMLQQAGWQPTWQGGEATPVGWRLHYRVRRGQTPVKYQRAAAYAVVFAPNPKDRDARLLLTQFARTNRDGWWGLPGGGIDPGEDPQDAVQREVMEETGQRIDRIVPLTVSTQHWVGRSPRGRLEDFQSVRMIYMAACDDPTETVVHDVGGTTADAAWVSREEYERLPVLEWPQPLIRRWWN